MIRPVIAIVGRPNVGKSTFVNALLGEERFVVSDVPGTTRDAIDSIVQYRGRRFVVTDTAGIRRKASIALKVESYSVVRAMKAIDEAEVVACLLDATEAGVDQDARLLGLVAEKAKALVVVVNKWDLAEREGATQDWYKKELGKRLPGNAILACDAGYMTAWWSRYIPALAGQLGVFIDSVAEEIGDAYGATIISGIEPLLRQHNFFFLTVVHRHDEDLLRSYSQLLLTRGAEGIITIDTSIEEKPLLPSVAIAGHQRNPNVTNIVLDHHCAARLVFHHLLDLGHRQIAFFRGPSSSSDSISRWNAIQDVAAELKFPIQKELVFELGNTPDTPDIGCVPAKALLATKLPFTALFAYNDTSAVGAMIVLQKAGLKIPGNVSVVGFDDINFSAFADPPLTTVHQPLLEMGAVAAQTLLDRIEDRAPFVPEIALAPKLIIRKSTGPVRIPSVQSA